ncbi:Uncharacterised protein [Paenibacillus macerans]|uniref:Putative membrane protein n=1 Tax=Paenibacillus macerans TaxID=44252 RepID=A0A090Y9F4_PAEMA|nr:putative membrane protein [Paenibacillus macerans]SUD25402.1 Uncharacterised protein [Paenibacillus macerans]
MRKRMLLFIMLSFLLATMGSLDSGMVRILIHGLGG